jgi:pimeloyl-ACP methyl ester carboxylesterase
MADPMSTRVRPWTETTLAAWRAACSVDAELSALAVNAAVTFAIRSGDDRAVFCFREGVLVGDPADDPVGNSANDAEADFTLAAAAEDWAKFFQSVPPPAYQNFFGMRMRVASAGVEGSELAMAQHAHLSRRVLELGRQAISGSSDGNVTENQSTDVMGSKAGLRSGYVQVTLDGQPLELFYEFAGEGQDVVLLHTAGADSRQYHDLMANPELTARCRMFAFDLPGHGRSDRLPNVPIGGYSLTTELYAQAIQSVIDALDLHTPIVSGSSMGGEICLEMAYRATIHNGPQGTRLGGVIACESSDNVPGRKVNWAKHPLVNESVFVPEWVYGLMAPQSPEYYRRKVWWGYSQGGFGTFAGDIDFYSGDWDARDRVGQIDTALCPVIMMTGEYDYSCTPAMSEATAKKIPGAVFWPMPELGHFPMAENPPLFARHFARALDQIGI